MEGLDLQAGSAALFDESEYQVIYAKGLFEKRYPASLTKIMTTLVALKYGDLDEMITVGEECKDIEYGSSVCEIQVGDQFTLRQLLYGLMINSGNDAAMTIAVNVGGTVEHFVELMNQEAAALGCTGTHFMNPHGLQDEDHYTTVYDIYLMFHEALKNETFQDIINRHSYYAEYTDANGEAQGVMWESTNHYFSNEAVGPSDVTIVGGKTGTTDAAGACLCLYSKNKYGDPFVSIIMKEESKDLLYDEMNELLSKINN
jgi:D-alanyl-D-alanine carboxypeptidase